MKVLWVDDDAATRRGIRTWCEDMSLAVEILASGEEAMPLIDHGDVSVVLTDSLGEGNRMSGLDLLRRVADVSPATVRLAVSANESHEYRRRASEVAAAYFLKPLHKEDLIAIEAAIRQAPDLVDLACAAAEKTASSVTAFAERMSAYALERT